jgi:hypothetical protein
MDGHSIDAFEYWSDEVANHPVWSEFFRRGVPMHPELKGLHPTGNMSKIGPNIGTRVQIVVSWTQSSVYCRPMSQAPPNLRRLLLDREGIERDVGVPKKWNEGSEEFLGLTFYPAPREEQKSWSTEQQVTELLPLYGRIKKYLQARMRSLDSERCTPH